jgi:hypothetical protein
MDREEKSKIVAEKARSTFDAIKQLRKTAPQFTRQQKDDLAAEIKKLQDQWWEEVGMFMTKTNGD